MNATTRILGLACLSIATPLIAGEIVSIWSKGAGAYVSASGDALAARVHSIGGAEEFVLLAADGDDETRRTLALADGSGRRFGSYHVEDLGHSYFAFKTEDGRYLGAGEAGALAVESETVGDAQRFAVVPMREGAKVIVRAYVAWEGQLYIDHPADYPTLKANINTLQLSAILSPPQRGPYTFYTREQLAAFRASFSTDRWESEFILRKTTEAIQADPASSWLSGVVERIELMEGLGYSCDYLIVYREPMVEGHEPGPWSDKRILSEGDVALIKASIEEAHQQGRVRNPSYRMSTLAYLFTPDGFNDWWRQTGLSQGLDEETRTFIKENFFALAMEINSHDYAGRQQVAEIAEAAAWCMNNGLDVIITSGGAGRDAGYKTMYKEIFAAMRERGVDPASPRIHYILHHVFQPYEHRLPEWEPDTVAENAKWLIEQVQQVRTMPTHKAAQHGLVGLRPLPRSPAEAVAVAGPGQEGLPLFDETLKGAYPFVAEHLDVLKGRFNGDEFKARRTFFEYYWGLDAALDSLVPEESPLVKLIRDLETQGESVEHILICREYALMKGVYPEAKPGPFPEDTRILFARDVENIRGLFRDAHQQGLLKHDNYKLIQMVMDPSFFATDERVHPIIKGMDGVCYEVHQFNTHWPLEMGTSRPEPIVRGTKWVLEQGKDLVFYYGPIIWKSEFYSPFVERDWLQTFWKAGLPKQHPNMHYYLNLFPHAHGCGRPVGPESDPHSILGFTKWLIEEIKGVSDPKESSEAPPQTDECNQRLGWRRFALLVSGCSFLVFASPPVGALLEPALRATGLARNQRPEASNGRLYAKT